MAKITGWRLSREWGVPAKHALYRKDGKWYHQLTSFPGALFDAEGYVLFETEAGYRSALREAIKQDVNISGGISQLPGYVRVVSDGQLRLPTEEERNSYERAQRAMREYREGGVEEVVLSRIERDPAARAACIAHFGTRCTACDLDFADRYGELGAGFIHVHHLSPLAGQLEERVVDPIRDLRPVCPNCHAMLHRRTPPVPIEELRWVLGSNGA